MPHHIDESRERPEQAVTDNSGNRGKTPDDAARDKGIGHSVHKAKEKKHRRDPKHTRLTSATDRAADKGDAER